MVKVIPHNTLCRKCHTASECKRKHQNKHSEDQTSARCLNDPWLRTSADNYQMHRGRQNTDVKNFAWCVKSLGGVLDQTSWTHAKEIEKVEHLKLYAEVWTSAKSDTLCISLMRKTDRRVTRTQSGRLICCFWFGVFFQITILLTWARHSQTMQSLGPAVKNEIVFPITVNLSGVLMEH